MPLQNGELIGVPVAIKRIERDEGGQHGRARTRPAADKIALRDECAADSSVNGCADLREFGCFLDCAFIGFAEPAPDAIA